MICKRCLVEGFIEQYPALKSFFGALRSVVNLIEQFFGARKQLVRFVEEGKVTLKTRGKKLDEIKESLKEARQQTLSLVTASKAVDKKRFKGMTRQRYKETNKGREPEDDGLKVLTNMRSGKLTDCVLIPLDHDEEWDFELVDEEGVEHRETYAKSEVCVRPPTQHQ